MKMVLDRGGSPYTHALGCQHDIGPFVDDFLVQVAVDAQGPSLDPALKTVTRKHRIELENDFRLRHATSLHFSTRLHRHSVDGMKSWALSVITLAYRPRVLRRVEDLHPLLRCA